MHTTKIISGNRITLPKEFLDFWNLKDGDIVGLLETKEKVVIIPVDVRPKK